MLGPSDPPPFTVHRPQGRSPFVLIADHAGQQIPAALAGLGLAQAERDRHIGWDIGIAGVTVELARLLDAWAITQTYSRLVIDCNRPLASPTLMPAISDHTVVPGNQSLSPPPRPHPHPPRHPPNQARHA
ncbi:MAG: N-formylglutamate amidohydrolase, partial [Stenotrophomonas sp.]